MSHIPENPRRKPYDIRERLLLFACDVVNVAQVLHRRGPIAGSLALQLVNAAVNAAANAEEADDGSSNRDFRAKSRICLREVKEARLRLRLLRQTGFLEPTHELLIQEATELKLIVATIVRNNERKDNGNKDKSPP
jgi:four helix bundle protein